MKKMIVLLIFISLATAVFAMEVKKDGVNYYVEQPTFRLLSFLNTCENSLYLNWNGECKQKYDCNADCTVCLNRKVSQSQCEGLGPTYQEEEPERTARGEGAVCMPSSFGESMQLCKDGFNINGFWYCDIDDVVECPGGCENGKCNSIRFNENERTPESPECSEGYMKCGGPFYDPKGKVQKCTNGKWEEVESCGELSCVEESTRYARCQNDIHFCTNGLECRTCSPRTGSFETLEACKQGTEVWCVNDNDKCVKRTGSCLNQEREFRSNVDGGAYSACVVTTACSVTNPCPTGFYCDINKCNQEEANLQEPTIFLQFWDYLRGLAAKFGFIVAVVAIVFALWLVRPIIKRMLTRVGLRL